ncbi:type II toxin-antitoxin system mRNA interferase toxin, RelE/StbE family [Pseudoalteromonas ruthenica]|uniref:Type II toxin-antitoxin system mRNA interferase toxin, RelE/StbE family n=1 Tax=Pseudoalteromonas ruthenica TaxID=151081 RepID=A0A5S3Z4S0_9GAMM|nr:type II toxin-antitoxin system mRNA interferase toxin, RelE/StbE family [Pseudoalteromonas ruthenica]TMO48452.1 type II toxin-antitoxin system mRNA interferase toxin, RelE/StbE family [Pseudoalteromonas ruthenica]TMP86825.1 type II toxin-antitoxin system mRNA interferase toxin, RelE/StbE family [Pseudoalteromonas ruthenica]
MAYEVKFSKKAEKAYGKLPNEVRRRIDTKLDYLRLTPRGTDTKKLQGYANTYRTRVGTYRIVFEIEDGELIVWILDVGHRGRIYS